MPHIPPSTVPSLNTGCPTIWCFILSIQRAICGYTIFFGHIMLSRFLTCKYIMIKWFTSKYIYIFIYLHIYIYIYIYTGIHTYIYNYTWYMWMYTCVSRKLTHFASDWSRYIFYFYIPLQTVCPPCLIPLIPIKSFLCTPIISYLPPLKIMKYHPFS